VILHKFIGYKAYYINRNAPVKQFSVVAREVANQHLRDMRDNIYKEVLESQKVENLCVRSMLC